MAVVLNPSIDSIFSSSFLFSLSLSLSLSFFLLVCQKKKKHKTTTTIFVIAKSNHMTHREKKGTSSKNTHLTSRIFRNF